MKAIIYWKTYECTLVEEPIAQEQGREWASNGLFIGDYETDKEAYRDWWLWRETEEQATKRNKRLRAYKNIRKRKTENDWDFVEDWENRSQTKCSLYYDYKNKEIKSELTTVISNWTIYFSLLEICKKAIKEIEADILIYLWVN